MIEIDPQDRLQNFTERKRPVGTVIIIILAGIAILGAGLYYWVFVSQKFADVYTQLNLAPLPITVELRPEFYNRLDQLKREPCYREAIIGLADSLLDSGYPRESATILLAFAQRCGDAQNEALLERGSPRARPKRAPSPKSARSPARKTPKSKSSPTTCPATPACITRWKNTIPPGCSPNRTRSPRRPSPPSAASGTKNPWSTSGPSALTAWPPWA